MDTLLGFFGIAIWIVLVIAIAAAVTWLVVKISTADKPKKTPPTE